MSFPELADIKSCTGCLGCMDACSQNAISKIRGKDGHIYVSVDRDLCIGCLKCERYCKHLHGRTYADNSLMSIPFVAKNTNENYYAKATSGGIFPALADYVLNQKGCVYGAAWDNDGRHVHHVRIDNIADIHLLQGSKYMQSDMSYIYKKVLADVQQGRMVLFIGTGCQVAAVLEFCKKEVNRHLLYTIDLVCGGVPSSLLMERFVANAKPAYFKTIRFRHKEKYVFVYEDNNGNQIVCKKALPLDGFKSSLTNRYSCYECRFAGLHRKSDWTIGDYWGDNASKDCRSLVLCHSERSKEILDELKEIEIEKISDWNFVRNNPRLMSFPFMNKRIERKLLAWNFQHLSYKTLCKLYASDIETWDILWMMYKIYRLIKYKLSIYNYKNHVNMIVNNNTTHTHEKDKNGEDTYNNLQQGG